METYDVLIIGGGVIGQATAYHLLEREPKLRVAIVERDPLYTQASSGLSVGGIRQQFGTAINIQITKAAVEFYAHIKEHFGDEVDIGFRQNGYLFLATQKSWPIFKERAALGQSFGVPVELLTPEQARVLIPGLRTDDIVGASFCSTDGYLDPASVLQAFRLAAKRCRAHFLQGEVADFVRAGDTLAAARLVTGDPISAGSFVFAAGAWNGALLTSLGVDLPVRPLRRQVHLVLPREPLPETIPLTIDPSGLHFRPESGGRLIVAHQTSSDGYDLPLDWDRRSFTEELWEPLASRVPSLSDLRLERGWAGYYDDNGMDHNAIIGKVPGTANAFTATGFSGHGLMQCPPATRGLAELIILGGYQTLDLSPLSPERFSKGQLIVEPAVI